MSANAVTQMFPDMMSSKLNGCKDLGSLLYLVNSEERCDVGIMQMKDKLCHL